MYSKNGSGVIQRKKINKCLSQSASSRSAVGSLGWRSAEGGLTNVEVLSLRAAFANKTDGAILIGMRKQERLFPLLISGQADQEAAVRIIALHGRRLRAMGADGFIH